MSRRPSKGPARWPGTPMRTSSPTPPPSGRISGSGRCGSSTPRRGRRGSCSPGSSSPTSGRLTAGRWRRSGSSSPMTRSAGRFGPGSPEPAWRSRDRTRRVASRPSRDRRPPPPCAPAAALVRRRGQRCHPIGDHDLAARRHPRPVPALLRSVRAEPPGLVAGGRCRRPAARRRRRHVPRHDRAGRRLATARIADGVEAFWSP